MSHDSKTSLYSHYLRNWPATIAEARVIQDRLRHKVRICPGPGHVTYVTGLDVSYPRNRDQPARAAAVVMHMKDLTVVEQAVVEQPVHYHSFLCDSSYSPHVFCFLLSDMLTCSVTLT